MPTADREWFVEAALEWTHDYILPVYQGTHDAPQTAAQTLDLLSGDCEDGAILLGCMIVSGLVPEAWPCAKLCVGTVDGMKQHAFLTWYRTDLEETVLLDWTVSPKPLTAEETAQRVRNTSPANSQERLTIPPTGWDGLNPVLVRIPCVAVAGNTEQTRLVLETIEWKGIVLDASVDGVFVAKACVAGGKRLVTSAKAASLSVVAPNPAKDMLSVSYTLREDGAVTLELVDMHGTSVQTMVQGEQAAGEYSMTTRLKNLPSGAYILRLVSAGGTLKTHKVEVVR
jgi:hypothetical protein